MQQKCGVGMTRRLPQTVEICTVEGNLHERNPVAAGLKSIPESAGGDPVAGGLVLAGDNKKYLHLFAPFLFQKNAETGPGLDIRYFSR